MIKPAYLGGVTEESLVAVSLCRGAVKDLVEARRQSAPPTANSLCPFVSFVVNFTGLSCLRNAKLWKNAHR